jgi:hypothetical protein
VEAGFDAFEEAGGDQGFDCHLEVASAEALAAPLEVVFCQALLARQEDGSQHLALSFPIHSFEGSSIRTYVRVGI